MEISNLNLFLFLKKGKHSIRNSQAGRGPFLTGAGSSERMKPNDGSSSPGLMMRWNLKLAAAVAAKTIGWSVSCTFWRWRRRWNNRYLSRRIKAKGLHVRTLKPKDRNQRTNGLSVTAPVRQVVSSSLCSVVRRSAARRPLRAQEDSRADVRDAAPPAPAGWSGAGAPGTGCTVRCRCAPPPPPTAAPRLWGSARTAPGRARSRSPRLRFREWWAPEKWSWTLSRC